MFLKKGDYFVASCSNAAPKHLPTNFFYYFHKLIMVLEFYFYTCKNFASISTVTASLLINRLDKPYILFNS